MKLILLVIILLHQTSAWKFQLAAWSKNAKRIIVGGLVSQCFASPPVPVLAADAQQAFAIAPSFQSQLKELEKTKGVVIPVQQAQTFQEQLKEIQNQKTSVQKEMLAKGEETSMTRQLTYPEGKLIARGVVSLEVKPSLEFGYYEAKDLDAAYEGEDSTMFILGVGREGPPLAAKRLKLKDLKFPYTFELTTDDLLFPYTESAWMSSEFRKDTIATTAIISTGNQISVPSQSERYGFGISDPTNFAGQVTRSPAKMNVVGKVDGSLYTPDDVKLLSSIDRGLDAKETPQKTPAVKK